MFTAADKALAALIMAAVFFINQFFNVNWVVDPETIDALVMVLTPIIVWAVPNRRKDE